MKGPTTQKAEENRRKKKRIADAQQKLKELGNEMMSNRNRHEAGLIDEFTYMREKMRLQQEIQKQTTIAQEGWNTNHKNPTQ